MTETDEMVPFISKKTIHINFEQCHSFVANTSNSIESRVVEELSCPAHEEADTKIVYHACSNNNKASIVIRNIDTDITAIMLGHMHSLQNGSLLWMLSSTGNNLRYVDLTKIHAKLGESICKSLPGFNSITGCDCNPAFFRKGKLRHYKILTKTEEYQRAFSKFGDSELFQNSHEQQKTFDIIQQFICEVYNVKGLNDINDTRLQLFLNTYKVSDINEAFIRKKLRNFDDSSLPPCKTELLQQFLRANFISSIWNNAHLKLPTIYQPDNNDWVQENNQYRFKWIEGDRLPNFVKGSLKNLSKTNEANDTGESLETDWSSSDEDYEYNDYNDDN